MVIEGRFKLNKVRKVERKKSKKPNGSSKKFKEDPNIEIPHKHKPFIESIDALKRRPLRQEALNLMYQISNIVTPLMKEYGLKIKTFTEMMPTNQNLLGLNVNRYNIKIRLRPSNNEFQFLPLNSLVGTMLHELTHITNGPHDSSFYKKLDEYIEKQEEYMRQGVDGERMFSKFKGTGNELGGKLTADIKARRLAVLDKKYIEGVSQLGGARREGDPRKLAAEAAIRRAEDAKWCHGVKTGELDESEKEDDIDELDEVDEVDEDGYIVVLDNDEEKVPMDKKRQRTLRGGGDYDTQKKSAPEIEVIALDSEGKEIHSE